MHSPFIDPHPIGQEGFSIYQFEEIRRVQTPCGGWVPEFILKRIGGPFPTWDAADDALCHLAGDLAIRPDRGRIWKDDGPGTTPAPSPPAGLIPVELAANEPPTRVFCILALGAFDALPGLYGACLLGDPTQFPPEYQWLPEATAQELITPGWGYWALSLPSTSGLAPLLIHVYREGGVPPPEGRSGLNLTLSREVLAWLNDPSFNPPDDAPENQP